MKHNEYELQKAVCKYLDLQYPNVLYLSDTIASIKLTMGQAMRNKAIQKQGFKTPDLIIFKPNSKFHGMMIELKTESPHKKNGDIKASQNDHLKLQENTLCDLMELGYYASFEWDFDTIKNRIDAYMEVI